MFVLTYSIWYRNQPIKTVSISDFIKVDNVEGACLVWYKVCWCVVIYRINGYYIFLLLFFISPVNFQHRKHILGMKDDFLKNQRKSLPRPNYHNDAPTS